MLALRGIEKAYGAFRVVRGVTLAVTVGEPVLLVGRNGAGKTTLLRIATGFLDADAGEVEVGGTVVDAAGRAHAQRSIGYLPEHAPAPLDLRVRDHLYFRARVKRVREARAAVVAAMAAADIADRADQVIGTLSKGYRQRVGLADALLGDPPLLVLDEPTSGMDPVQTAELRDRLAALAKTRAVLISSHAVADLEPLVASPEHPGRVAVLRDGELVADAAPAALCAEAMRDRLDAAVKVLLEGGR